MIWNYVQQTTIGLGSCSGTKVEVGSRKKLPVVCKHQFFQPTPRAGSMASGEKATTVCQNDNTYGSYIGTH